ncbi:MAG: ATP phosphoribosyltransferase [Candidatus Omnitrophota bacterium]|jgi:ATP phosphoribosyltransferase
MAKQAEFKLKFGLPSGSLQEATIKMLSRAGFKVSVRSRSYFPSIDDHELDPVLLRAQEMSRYVEQGALDCGITGEDWILENGSDVVRIQDMVYGKTGRSPVRWVLAVPNESKIKSIKDLKGKRIATELKGFTQAYFKKHGVPVDVEFSWGATEVKVGYGLVDAIVDITETGSSLRANNLRIVETLCHSTTKFIANKAAWDNPKKRKKIEAMALLFKSAIEAQSKVGLKMNVEAKDLDKILKKLPALKKPTVAELSAKGWLDVDTIVDDSEVKHLIPALKAAGASGIIEYPLNKVVD